MSTDLEAARAQLADARREKEEVDGLIDALEERVRSGQEQVNAQQLGEKYGLQRLAELQQERAERRVEAAEAEARRQALAEARKVAADELSAVSTEALDVLHRKALVALDDFVSACQAREQAIGRHADQLKQLGDRQIWVDTNSSDVAVRVGGELYRLGAFLPEAMAVRAVGAVLVARADRWHGFKVGRPDKHPLDEPVMNEMGLAAVDRETNWGSRAFAERMLGHARATVEGGEAA
ncbi:hypothetical protein ACFVAF_04240 [Streptomyces sp. NPDC057596]|uniref:hypothetical protein n=1 Tax=Streptomyces sp. NPDC057596 TaxID=3346178 RepID=UPI00369F6534